MILWNLYEGQILIESVHRGPAGFLRGSGSHLSVALEVRMDPFGAGELQQPQCDHSGFHFGINVPDGTVVVALRCVRRPAGAAERRLIELFVKC